MPSKNPINGMKNDATPIMATVPAKEIFFEILEFPSAVDEFILPTDVAVGRWPSMKGLPHFGHSNQNVSDVNCATGCAVRHFNSLPQLINQQGEAGVGCAPRTRTHSPASAITGPGSPPQFSAQTPLRTYRCNVEYGQSFACVTKLCLTGL